MYLETCTHSFIQSSLRLDRVGGNCLILHISRSPLEFCQLGTESQHIADTLDDPPLALGLAPVARQEVWVCSSPQRSRPNFLSQEVLPTHLSHALWSLFSDHQHRTGNKMLCVPCSPPFFFLFPLVLVKASRNHLPLPLLI